MSINQLGSVYYQLIVWIALVRWNRMDDHILPSFTHATWPWHCFNATGLLPCSKSASFDITPHEIPATLNPDFFYIIFIYIYILYRSYRSMMNYVGGFSCTFSIYDFHSRKPPDFLWFPDSLPIPFAQELHFWHLGPLRIRMLLLVRLQCIDEMLDG